MVKPDQLIKRRGKLGLIKVNATLAEVQQWIGQRINKDVQVRNPSLCLFIGFCGRWQLLGTSLTPFPLF